MPRLLVLAAVTAGLLSGCGGTPCDDLPALQAERDAAREAYAELVRPGTAPPEVTERADADLHELERRVFDVEQECDGR